MTDELNELLDAAIDKEIASRELYIAAQTKTRDPGARTLLKELADEEVEHSELLKKLKEKGWEKQDWHQGRVQNLRISEHLTGGETLEGAGLQDTLIFAMKREQEAVEFYSRMTEITRDVTAKRLCEKLVHEELKHKLRLETFYDDYFYVED